MSALNFCQLYIAVQQFCVASSWNRNATPTVTALIIMILEIYAKE